MSIKEHPPQSPSSSGARLHVPVLLDATLDVLRPVQGESYLDLTAGYGGHARAFLARTENYSDAVLVDRDDYALLHVHDIATQGSELIHSDYVDAAAALISRGRQFDVVLVDLGVSSPQLDQSERGFSFSKPGPLDMRMDRRAELTAETLVNTASESELTRIITEYGEEPRTVASRIARAIIAHRPIHTTTDLAQVVLTTHRGRWQRTHPATRTFQALRIAVNDELKQVETMLEFLPRLLRSGGRVGIISFHSLEDRLVKRFFKSQADAGYEASLRILTAHPIEGALHDVHNPRARSAKLRAAVKI